MLTPLLVSIHLNLLRQTVGRACLLVRSLLSPFALLTPPCCPHVLLFLLFCNFLFKCCDLFVYRLDVDFIQSDITYIRSSVGTIETDVSVYLKDIFEKVSGIYSHAKWR